MALTTFNEDMEIISKLSTYPNDTDGLTPEELKTLNRDVQVEQDEYDEVVAVKPLFLNENYR